MDPSFVHLHNHSEYSLLDGSCRISEMVRLAREFGQPAVAMTDHGNLFGALKFYRAAREAGIQPIIGVEAYMAVGSRFGRGEAERGGARKPYHHMILLAADLDGYRNLLKLVSSGYTEGFYYRPRIDRELLAEHARGLIGTSGCLSGEIPHLLLTGRREEAARVAAAYAEIFGPDRFYLEIQDQGIPEEATLNEELAQLARATGLPLLATNDCHYLRREDYFAHDVLLCIQTGKTVDEPRALRFTDQHYFKSSAEMRERFRHLPEAAENTLKVAGLCHLELPPSGYQLPAFPVPEGEGLEGYFRRVVTEGFERRRTEWEKLEAEGRLTCPLAAYEERVAREVELVVSMGFAGYFLIVWDLIRHARDRGIPVGPGRGSAAGSLVAYCLRITDIDPLRYGLLFERFLNPERVTMPDIDIDFCMRGRGRVIEYVTEKYGRENVAQIITFGTMAARAVIRDAGRGLNIPYARVDRIAKLVPPALDVTVDSALATVPELAQAQAADPDIRRLLDVARRLEGLPRHASTHAAGVVIAPAPITTFAPLYQVREGERTTQFPMEDIESIGLLKMDFLGLKTLTLLDDITRMLATGEGTRLDLDRLPLDDRATYELFSRGATSGIFQFESDGMRDILRKFRPERFEDLIALNALYRPGPLKGGLVDEFIKRRHGRKRADDTHPHLREILEETYGVIVYQEQVMRIASQLGGFSLGAADLLRRAMGKKDRDLLASQRERFLSGSRERGIAPRDGEWIWKQMEEFAGYGFNKSHSAAYALIAYQTAYLKSHHPVPFMAALLTSEKNNTDKLVSYLNECREMGIEVRPPDLLTSEANFVPEEQAIRFGLGAIKNVGEGAIESILDARRRLGGVPSLHALTAALDGRLVNKRVIESLIKSGSLDRISPVRARLMASVDAILDRSQKEKEARSSGQGALFGGADTPAVASAGDVLVAAPPWTDHETLAFEKESLGFYLSGHPLVDFAAEMAQFATHDAATLRRVRGGQAVAVAGMIAGIRKRKTRKGEWMAVLSLDDREGVFEAVVFPALLATSGETAQEDAAVLIMGRAEGQPGEDRGRILAEEIIPLAEVRTRRARSVAITLETPGLDGSVLQSLRGALREHTGSVPVVFVVREPSSFTAEMRPRPELRVKPSADLVRTVEELLGPGSVRFRLQA